MRMTVRRFRRAILMSNILGLVGCVTVAPTKYQPLEYTGGFRDQQLQEDIFHVEFLGNGYTPPGTVRNYFLFRCAEIAAENGFASFEIVDGNFLNTQGGFGIGGTFALFSKPQIEGVVRMHRGPAPPGSNHHFNAEELMRNLEGWIQRGE